MPYEIRGNAFAAEEKTVSTTAVGGTSATYAPAAGVAKGVVINPADQDLIFRIDGGTPTASVGLRLAAGDNAVIYGEANVRNLLMIREDASDSAVSLTYLR